MMRWCRSRRCRRRVCAISTGNEKRSADKNWFRWKPLAPGVAFSFDDIDLRLTLSASPELLGLTVRDLWSGRPANLIYRKDTSSYVNYSANWHSNRQFDVFAESATSVRGASFYNSVSANRQSVSVA